MDPGGGCLSTLALLASLLQKGQPETTTETKGLALLPVASLYKWPVIPLFEVRQPTFILVFIYKQVHASCSFLAIWG